MIIKETKMFANWDEMELGTKYSKVRLGKVGCIAF